MKAYSSKAIIGFVLAASFMAMALIVDLADTNHYAITPDGRIERAKPGEVDIPKHEAEFQTNYTEDTVRNHRLG